MHSDIVDTVTEELLTIQPLIFRSIRRTLSKSVLSMFDPEITPLHVEILKLLEKSEKLSISEIGEHLQVARAQMTRLLDKLVTKGLIVRNSAEDDRRVIYIELTQEARGKIKEQDKYIKEAFNDSLKSLNEAELNEIKISLIKLNEALSESVVINNQSTEWRTKQTSETTYS